MPINYKEIGNSLKRHFKEQGLTQDKIASILGISQAAVNAQLNGKPFGKKSAEKWGNAFGIKPNWLLTGDGAMLKTTDQPVSQGGSDVTPPEADLNNPRTMERLLEMLERRDTEFRELLRQNGELIEMLKQERGNRGTTYAQKKEA
ncbi:helix-turn-helix domain-containing protein [Alistipes sp.]|uniref:helix-turn-helix domain-containing protein n=1 Tax=Alistipes sp. TaxID=1872444 RepID=UPI003AB1620A